MTGTFALKIGPIRNLFYVKFINLLINDKSLSLTFDSIERGNDHL